MEAKSGGYNGHDANGGAGEWGAMEPPTTVEHHWGLRVKAVEANNEFSCKERLTTSTEVTIIDGRVG